MTVDIFKKRLKPYSHRRFGYFLGRFWSENAKNQGKNVSTTENRAFQKIEAGISAFEPHKVPQTAYFQGLADFAKLTEIAETQCFQASKRFVIQFFSGKKRKNHKKTQKSIPVYQSFLTFCRSISLFWQK